MTVHIIKLCVGVDSVDDLEHWLDHRKPTEGFKWRAYGAYPYNAHDSQASDGNSGWGISLLGDQGDGTGATADH